jgi:hypothetical protein
VKVETVEIACSKETLGQSNHFKLKTSEIMKVRNLLSPVLLPSITFNFIPSIYTHSAAEDRWDDV